MDRGKEKYSASPPVLKKMIPQLLLSVSIFSFVFSYSSLYSSSSSSSSLAYSLRYKFHHNFSVNYSFPFLSHIALNKNCLFLICNGLLVFLTKTSGLVRPPPEASTFASASTSDLINDILQKRIGDGLQMPMDQTLPPEEINQPKEEEKKPEDHESNWSAERSSEDVSITIAESEEEGRGGKDGINDESRTCWLFDGDDNDGEQLYGRQVEEERGEEEEEKEELSIQELNQKFEDFIRRMKEEIMINDARPKVIVLK